MPGCSATRGRCSRPIEWDEPFGLVLIEAMLSGCPVVAFGRGSVPELVEPGVTGFIVRTRWRRWPGLIRPGGPVDRLDRRRIRALAVAAGSAAAGWWPSYERLYRLRGRRWAGGWTIRAVTAA